MHIGPVLPVSNADILSGTEVTFFNITTTTYSSYSILCRTQGPDCAYYSPFNLLRGLKELIRRQKTLHWCGFVFVRLAAEGVLGSLPVAPLQSRPRYLHLACRLEFKTSNVVETPTELPYPPHISYLHENDNDER